MAAQDSLHVWNEDRQVGTLWRNRFGHMGFRYDPRWISGGGFALSLSLPLTTREFLPEDAIAHRFFANLLPEGAVREGVVRDLKIPGTDFDLLRAIGGECAGALSILPTERTPSEERPYRRLTDEDLTRLAQRRAHAQTLWSGDRRPRLSLAGAQDKCPVLVRDDVLYLPLGESPSSHILKFELADYRHVPAYETFTTSLAGAVGLPVVAVALRAIDQTRYVLIHRYDRVQDQSGAVRRLHQEDFCQALGCGSDQKYQEHGGPAFSQCYRLLQEASSEPALDAQHLLRWQIFNVLAGNSNGHAKNLPLLHLPDGETGLAPFYDLLCTRAIERIDDHLALDVGGQRNPSLVTFTHWEELARQCDVRPRFLSRLVQETAAALMEHLAPTRRAFEERHGPYPALQRIEQIVLRQCRRL